MPIQPSSSTSSKSNHSHSIQSSSSSSSLDLKDLSKLSSSHHHQLHSISHPIKPIESKPWIKLIDQDSSFEPPPQKFHPLKSPFKSNITIPIQSNSKYNQITPNFPPQINQNSFSSTNTHFNDQDAANQLLAQVNLNDALEFVQNSSFNSTKFSLPSSPKKTQTSYPSTSSTSPNSKLSSKPSVSSPPKSEILSQTLSASDSNQSSNLNPNSNNNSSNDLPINHQSFNLHPEDPSPSTHHQRLKTISMSLLRSVSRKRQVSDTHQSTNLSSIPPTFQSLPLPFQSLINDPQHPIQDHPINRPFFIVDVRSIAIASEKYNANPSQIRRVEECKRFFSLRYEPIFSALAEGKSPPSLIKVAEWRRKIQLVSIIKRKHQTILLSPSNLNDPSKIDLNLKLHQAIQPDHLSLSSQLPKTYKWICLSSRKRRTIWEICPEDLEAYIRSQGSLQAQEEFSKIEHLFGKLDQLSGIHSRPSRSRLNSNKLNTRLNNQTNHILKKLSDSDLTWAPNKINLNNKLSSAQNRFRKTSSNTSTSSLHNSKPESLTHLAQLNSPCPSLSDLNPSRPSESSHQTSNIIKGKNKPSLNSPCNSESNQPTLTSKSQLNQPVKGLLLDTSTLFFPSKLPADSPKLSSLNASSLPSSADRLFSKPSPFNENRNQLLLKTSTSAKTQGSKTCQTTNRSDDSRFTESGDKSITSLSPRPSHGQRPSDLEKNSALASQKGLSDLTQILLPSPQEKLNPHLGRTTSTKGLLNFAKRSMVTELISPSSSTSHTDRQIESRPIKRTFLYKPPRDWLGWKFDKSTIKLSEKSKTYSEKVAPVSGILFSDRIHPPLSSSKLNFKGDLERFDGLKKTLPIIISDITENDVHDIKFQLEIMSSQIKISTSNVEQSQIDYTKYLGLLLKIRKNLGLEPNLKVMLSNACWRSKSPKRSSLYEESIRSSSTHTDGSVLSQSLIDEEVERADKNMDIGIRLTELMSHMEVKLEELELKRKAIRDELWKRLKERTSIIQEHEVFLASCTQRQELMRQDRELVNQIKRTVRIFQQEGKMIDNTILAIANGIFKPLIIGLVSILTKIIGIALKLFSLHLKFYKFPILGLVYTISFRIFYINFTLANVKLIPHYEKLIILNESQKVLMVFIEF
ncbi:hypothetical protein O181_046285 [Austropuccinia psidii MF-1]|uniref:Uncharacterized protein n=1 Tax=Austropuccinia psidii MF-1 TaxID=1389203 RepID=A0A9Q3DT18_9BASI|nr:hypothetical protein [Austropuccinia psidii MF-1]